MRILLIMMSVALSSCIEVGSKKGPARFEEKVLNDNPRANYKFLETELVGVSCLRCHDSQDLFSDTPYLDTYEGLKSAAQSSLDAIRNGDMPKDGDNIPKEIVVKALEDWIANDFPESGEQTSLPKPDPVDPIDPIDPVDSKVNYEFIRTELIEVSCLQCHDGTKERFKKPALNTYEQVVGKSDRILDRILDQEDLMPPMKKGTVAPSELVIQALKDWIATGMPKE